MNLPRFCFPVPGIVEKDSGFDLAIPSLSVGLCPLLSASVSF